MAGDWIKIEHVTPDKPEVVRMAAFLNMDRDLVVGKLVRFWIWCDTQLTDGNAKGVTHSFIDDLTRCPGFAEALIDADWLVARQGSLLIPHFIRHHGQSAKNRALVVDRVRRYREGSNAPGVTKALPEKSRTEERGSLRSPSDGRARDPVQKVEGAKPEAAQISTSSNAPSVTETPEQAALRREMKQELPRILNTPEFKAAWQKWLEYLVDKFGKMPPFQTMDTHKRICADIATAKGIPAAINALEFAISANKTVPVDDKRGGRNTSNGQPPKSSRMGALL
jgi:hypothetical protein